MQTYAWPYIREKGCTTVFFDNHSSFDFKFTDENLNAITIGFSRTQLEILRNQIEQALSGDPFSKYDSEGKVPDNPQDSWNDPLFVNEQINQLVRE